MAKINEYPQAVSINNNDLFVIDQESGGDHATKSASVSQIADKATAEVKEDIGNLSNLTTTDKSSLVGAVNEVDSDISNRQAYTYRVTNVGSKITIRMKTTSTGEFLYHIVGSVSNGQSFYDSIITGSVSGGAVYCKNIGQNQLGTPIITNNVIKFTVANWSQLLITGLSPVSEITATPT